MFEPYLSRWGLIPDGEPIITPGSRLLPVTRAGAAAMLKMPLTPEEQVGSRLMTWLDGDGAARVLEAGEHGVLLLERAQGAGDLVRLAAEGRDEEATLILCNAAARLHAPRTTPAPELTPLRPWFASLEQRASAHPHLAAAWTAARRLLDSPREVAVLHGDLHHENVLDFGPRGWLVIDPKGLIGERGFDYAMLFCDPDLGRRELRIARRRDIFERRLEVVAATAALERPRLLQWILATAGLSAAWFLEDGESPDINFEVADMALAALGSGGAA